MSTPAQRRGRNYMIIGLLMIGGAAALYYYASTMTIPEADRDGFLSQITLATSGFAAVGLVAILVGGWTRMRGAD